MCIRITLHSFVEFVFASVSSFKSYNYYRIVIKRTFQVVEGMTLLQCVGIATCPYIFILTSTTKIRKVIHAVSLALMARLRGRKKRVRVSPAYSED